MKGDTGGENGRFSAQLHCLSLAQGTKTRGIWVDKAISLLEQHCLSTSFPTILSHVTVQHSGHRAASLPKPRALCLYVFLVLPPLPGPPSLPFLLEKFYPSIKVTFKYSSLKPPLILASSHRRHASAFTQYY